MLKIFLITPNTLSSDSLWLTAQVFCMRICRLWRHIAANTSDWSTHSIHTLIGQHPASNKIVLWIAIIFNHPHLILHCYFSLLLKYLLFRKTFLFALVFYSYSANYHILIGWFNIPFDYLVSTCLVWYLEIQINIF